VVPRKDWDSHFQFLVCRERENIPMAQRADWSSVDVIPHLDPTAYDELLSCSLVFLDLYDSVVNNTVIECIVRGTPLICNCLPALVELLGEDYPMFFSTLEEAAAKAEDAVLIERAVAHLRAIPKDPFSGEYFAQSVADSYIYRCLPPHPR
jgi:hypothetical protein